ncbi:hypothetical protein D3C80_768970 [compost metagenome]
MCQATQAIELSRAVDTIIPLDAVTLLAIVMCKHCENGYTLKLFLGVSVVFVKLLLDLGFSLKDGLLVRCATLFPLSDSINFLGHLATFFAMLNDNTSTG